MLLTDVFISRVNNISDADDSSSTNSSYTEENQHLVLMPPNHISRVTSSTSSGLTFRGNFPDKAKRSHNKCSRVRHTQAKPGAQKVLKNRGLTRVTWRGRTYLSDGSGRRRETGSWAETDGAEPPPRARPSRLPCCCRSRTI